VEALCKTAQVAQLQTIDHNAGVPEWTPARVYILGQSQILSSS